MNLKHDKTADSRRKPDPASTGNSRAASTREPKPEVGGALRSIYQRTVEEEIPPEMLDLLGKLG